MHDKLEGEEGDSDQYSDSGSSVESQAEEQEELDDGINKAPFRMQSW